MTEFLQERQRRPLSLKGLPVDLRPLGLWVGQGESALEVALFAASKCPPAASLQRAWRLRRGGRATPVLVVVRYGKEPEKAAVCGISGEQPPVYPEVALERVERLCRQALCLPNRHAVHDYLGEALKTLGDRLAGVMNRGLVSRHTVCCALRDDPERSQACTERARATLGKSGEPLLQALGYEVEQLDNYSRLLRAGGRRRALAVLADADQEPGQVSRGRFNGLSPLSYAFGKAEQEELDWVLLVRGSRVRLYGVRPGAGVGRRSRTDTWLECDPPLMDSDGLACTWLLLSAEALSRGGSLEQLLQDSGRYAAELAHELRERIYDKVVPRLTKAIVKALRQQHPEAELLELTHRMAMQVLFRLLFVAYAEDRDLLPYEQNEDYRTHSLTKLAEELARHADAPQVKEPGVGTQRWAGCRGLWQAVEKGKAAWGVPPYNGGLFSTDPQVSKVGAELETLELPDDDFEPVLLDLLLTKLDGRLQPVDFRSLDVREFGTIYEGLLESEPSIAATDLSLSKKGAYLPAKRKDKAAVRAGEVYLHDRSGARKSSGSYYTKDFIVQHLLEAALEPALQAHCKQLDRLKQQSEEAAAAAFFSFRVADIAMGSGHFLIAATDRIEQRLSAWLDQNPLPGVTKELQALEQAARHNLGEAAAARRIDRVDLLRRQIARRCIHGVDLNENAVQLARVALWIHTFVPGLPLSLLDHNLVCGNSLIGVSNLQSLHEQFNARKGTLLAAHDPQAMLAKAAAPLNQLAKLQDATLQDIAAGRKARQKATKALQPLAALCDLVTAQPLAQKDTALAQFPFEDWERHARHIQTSSELTQAKQLLHNTHHLHFPICFPQVFLHEKGGFDLILGNPPWNEPIQERHKFWTRHFPGLHGMKTQAQKEQRMKQLERQRPDLKQQLHKERQEQDQIRNFLTASGNYPGMGTGDADLYKAFCWRFWDLTTPQGGSIGVVLPRNVTTTKGSTDFRHRIFQEQAETTITTLLNKKGWVFEQVHPRFTIALLSIKKGTPKATLRLQGPFTDANSFQAADTDTAHAFTSQEVLTWNNEATLPLLPTPESAAVFAQLRKAPRLDLWENKQWRARPDTDLHATNDKKIMAVVNEPPSKHHWPVLKGESFDLWQPDKGVYYAWANPGVIQARLQAKRARWTKAAARAITPPPRTKAKLSPEPPLAPADQSRPGTHHPLSPHAPADPSQSGTNAPPPYAPAESPYVPAEVAARLGTHIPQPQAQVAEPPINVPYISAETTTEIPSTLPRSAHAEFSPSHLQNPDTLPCHQARIAFRDVTNRTNNRTIIACLLPPQMFLTNKAPYLLWPRGDERDQAFLLGMLCSMPLDWYARRFVELNLNYFIFNPLPIPRPARSDPRWKRVVRLAGRLACPDDRFAAWAKAAGVQPGPLPDPRKQDMIHELDALSCHLYGLSRRQIEHLYATFHEGWDHRPRLQAVLTHWQHLNP